ncbi:hypothetical protein D0867_06173 [Hortaea werneckii]|uniref:Uncharacterized protein n=1 Tax=Hortaea werneckii TaxID=91943 RepID=A0A3M6ZPN7_HORWE|nr:hypothetical protein D0867_06173 [Hortaea werneckii]
MCPLLERKPIRKTRNDVYFSPSYLLRFETLSGITSSEASRYTFLMTLWTATHASRKSAGCTLIQSGKSFA